MSSPQESLNPMPSYDELLIQLRRKTLELSMMHRIRSVLLTNHDLNNVYQATVDLIATSLKFPYVSLYLLDNGRLVLKAQRGYNRLPVSPEIQIGFGLVGIVARSGKPAMLPDPNRPSDFRPMIPGVKSQICVPLMRTGNEVVGVLSVESIRPSMPEDYEVRLCQAAADYTVVSLETNRLYHSEQRRAEQMGVLNRIGRELVSLLDITEIIERVTGAVRQKLNYYNVNVGLIEGNELVFTTGVDNQETTQKPQYRMPLKENCFACYAARNEEMVLVPEVSRDERYRPNPEIPLTRSQIVLPLRDANRVIGVLDVQSDRPYAFDDDEVILLKTLADQVSIALSNALRFQDISKQKEELGQKNKELAEANRLKNEFLANVSHELRTPLNSIMGYVEMIRSQFYGEVPDSFDDPLERVERNSRRLLTLINDVLDLSKLEAGRDQLAIEKFPLMEAIRFTCDPAKDQAASQGLDFNVIVSPEIPRMVENDPKRLGQLLTHLLSNAIKFTPSGFVRVEINPTITDEAQPGYSIKVFDSGIGIPQEHYEHIFESFRQLDGSTTRTFGGTGLGLAICLKLVRMMKGKITVESEVGKGSCFTVVLPVSMA